MCHFACFRLAWKPTFLVNAAAVALTVTVNLLTFSSVFGFVGVVQTMSRPSYCISVVFWSS